MPPEDFGRSFKLLIGHDSGVGANIFGDYCNYVRPNGTLGG